MIRWLLWLLLLAAAPAAADEFRPAYLQLTQTGPAAYDVMWKLPALDADTVLKVQPVFPPNTRNVTEPRSAYDAGTAILRWRITVPGGLDNRPITFPGLAKARIDVLVRVVRLDKTVQLEPILAIDP